MTVPICFDMDGVILEGPRTAPQVYDDAADAALEELGAEPTPAQRRALRSQDTEAIRGHCVELGLDPDRFWTLKERYASAGTHERLRSGARGLYDDIDAVRTLADRAETPVGLVTNNRHETAAFVADFVDVPFDVVRGRDPTIDGFRRRKPDPYYLEDALVQLDGTTTIDRVRAGGTGTGTGDGRGEPRGLYVGDSPKDVVAGTKIGFETAFIRRPHNRDLECPADATYDLESLTELLDLEIVEERV
ncbi:HAD family hydrolase [Halopiger xanaduensis]|uniref:Haloacid dehalogenase domain protein hydrolase n=1 Tax=Halopiger xanaduensis (strain DSM 18323 / JCM 14033 / SH-6) TaxID=797210 RepID=F8D3V8_HALXS|nr:HAD family hydrolase [Halopiger xanaduensis]AEH38613.1 Haloacid dehalogenase domain protein hydrolase [Halopiger xanaduensis SH-6]